MLVEFFFFFPLTSVGVDSTGEDIHSLLINNCLPLRAPPVLGAAVLNGLPPRLPAAGADSRRRLRRRGEHITLDYVALCLPAAAADCFSDAVAVTLPFSPKSFCLFFFPFFFSSSSVSLTDQPDARKRDQVCSAGADGAEVRSPAAADKTHKLGHRLRKMKGVTGGKK